MKNKGYIALTSVLVIAAIILTVGTSVTLLSISEAQVSLASKKSLESLDFVEGCLEEALLYLNENNTLPSTAVLPQGSCSVTLNSQTSNTWDLTVAGSQNNYYKTLNAVIDRTGSVNITSWKETE